LKKYKSSRIDQILAELIQAWGGTLQSDIHKLINSILNKGDFLDQWKESISALIYKKGNKTDCNNYHGISLFISLIQNFIQYPSFKGKSIYRWNYWGSSMCFSM
jgi:hypothetical protein